VRWAHQNARLYPDGQLYLDLAGHSRDWAMTPGEALTFALFLSVPALLIALGAAFTRWRTRNAPLPPPVFVVLLVLLLGNSAWMPGVFMSMG